MTISLLCSFWPTLYRNITMQKWVRGSDGSRRQITTDTCYILPVSEFQLLLRMERVLKCLRSFSRLCFNGCI